MYVASKPPKGSKTQSDQNLNINLRSLKRYEIGCQLLLMTDRNSHTGFRLIPTSVTLNDRERRIALIFLFSLNSTALLANYVTVVEDRPIMSAK